MKSRAVLEWLRQEGSPSEVAGMTRFGIPNDRAFGVPMRSLRGFAKELGRSHSLAEALWETGWYEARTLAALVDEPAEVTEAQMDAWAADFDSWAICDTTCFHLFDRTPHAWKKVPEWTASDREFVRRAGYALIWALSVHDKTAPDERFLDALAIMEAAEPDSRPLVRKAVDMALRATGKRNRALHGQAMAVAERLADSENDDRSWIGGHALRELDSEKVRARVGA